MLNYMRGEFYRVLRKKSMYIYFASFAALYFLYVFLIRSGGEDASEMMLDAAYLFDLLPAIIGGYFFAAFYVDDLSSKNLTTLVGFGMSKTMIVAAKLILAAMFVGVILGLLPLIMSAFYIIFGLVPTSSVIGSVYGSALYVLLITLACAAVSAIAVYGLQRPTFGMVAYVLLALGVINQLVTLLFMWKVIRGALPHISDYTMFSISRRVMNGVVHGDPLIFAVLEYIVYVAAAVALSVLAFNKKELEF